MRAFRARSANRVRRNHKRDISRQFLAGIEDFFGFSLGNKADHRSIVHAVAHFRCYKFDAVLLRGKLHSLSQSGVCTHSACDYYRVRAVLLSGFYRLINQNIDYCGLDGRGNIRTLFVRNTMRKLFREEIANGSFQPAEAKVVVRRIFHRAREIIRFRIAERGKFIDIRPAVIRHAHQRSNFVVRLAAASSRSAQEQKLV